MLSSLPDLQKEKGLPHPSRKKKTLKLKRESTFLSRVAPIRRGGPFMSATVKKPGQATHRTGWQGCCACSWGASMKHNLRATHGLWCFQERPKWPLPGSVEAPNTPNPTDN